jgi:hypothetical protein
MKACFPKSERQTRVSGKVPAEGSVAVLSLAAVIGLWLL